MYYEKQPLYGDRGTLLRWAEEQSEIGRRYGNRAYARREPTDGYSWSMFKFHVELGYAAMLYGNKSNAYAQEIAVGHCLTVVHRYAVMAADALR